MNNNKERFLALKMMAYYLLFALWYVISLLPFWFLYLLSSLFYVILYHIVRYRRQVVRQNIQDSFPDMPLQQRLQIERKFYAHFCDVLFESVKYFSISKKEMRRRMAFQGVELLNESFDKGRSCAVFLGHYANWEWISSMPLWVDPAKCLCTQLYHPLENLVVDKLIGYTRQRFGGVNVPVDFSIRHIIECKKKGQPLLLGFIADQAPFWNNIHYWTNFLNHPDTPVFTGAERLMRKFDMDVYYLDVRRIGRGRYVAEYKRLTTTPQQVPEFELTELYTRLFEQTILRDPAYWLWTHKRWKRTKEEWLRNWAPK